jgi:hypothetical protein
MGEKYFPFKIEQFDLVNYLICIIDRFRQVFENLAHLVGCLKKELIVRESESFIFCQNIIISELTKRRRTLFFTRIYA